MVDALEIELDALRARLVEAAKHLRGVTVLRQRVYGVGPIGGLAFTCWLGGADRFSSRKAVRFCGLDVTVYSSAGKRAPGACPGRGHRSCGGSPTRRHDPRPRRCPRPRLRREGQRPHRRQAAALAEARTLARVVSHILADLGEDVLSWGLLH